MNSKSEVLKFPKPRGKCHVKKTPDKLIPGRMDAFHGQCMGCHEKLGKGPFGKDKCAQCHTK